MRVIICNIQMFSIDQMIYVYDIEKNQAVFAQKADNEDLVNTICTIANTYGVNEVKLSGQTAYAMQFAEEIGTAYALNYNNNNINVEVI